MAEKITFSSHLFALHDYLFIGDNRANGYKNWFLGDVDDDRNYVSCIQDLEVFKSNVDKDDPRKNAVKTMVALTKNANGYVNDFLRFCDIFCIQKKLVAPDGTTNFNSN